MKITPAGLRFYCAWQGARKKRLHSQLLEFLNTNNILWDQWAGAGPPHPARLLRPQTSSDCAAGKRASPGLGRGGARGVPRAGRGPGAGRCSAGLDGPGALPAGSGGEARAPGWGELGAPAHLQRRVWKRLAREGAPSTHFPARRPPAGPGPSSAPLAWPWPPRRLRKAGFPEWLEGGGESAPRPWSHPSPSLSRPSRAGALEADSGAAGCAREASAGRGARPRARDSPQGPAGDPRSRAPRDRRRWPGVPEAGRPASAHSAAWVWFPAAAPPPPPRARPQHA